MPAQRLSVCLFAVLLAGIGHAATPVTVETANARFEIDPATLEIRGGSAGAEPGPVAAAAFAVPGDVEWHSRSPLTWSLTVDGARYAVTVAAEGDLLSVRITAREPGPLTWPGRVGGAAKAFALPIFGEGKFVPAGDREWVAFLTQRATRHDVVGMSLPLATALFAGRSLSVIVDPPYDTDLLFSESAGRLAVSFEHTFSPLDPDAAYELRFALGPEDPVAGAKRYRRLLQDTGRFLGLDEKARANPDVARLRGAPHIYLWERGPLKAGDITDWPALLRRYADRRTDASTFSARLADAMPAELRADLDQGLAEAVAHGYTTRYQRTVFTRALNAALRTAVPLVPHAPLPGGHDPYAENGWIAAVREALTSEFPGCFAAPASWGGGLSLSLIDALHKAGIRTAWLGAENWLDMLWHPEAAAAARDSGYLLGVYDSYGSAHPEDLADTWETAQMGDAIFETAAYRRADGSRVAGFLGRGVYVNPVAIEDYAHARISAVAGAGKLDSYFLDVDATGENSVDYTEGRRTSRREVEQALRRRLAFTSETLGLVTGSEGGVSLFARELDFAHGMTTVPFKWTNQAMTQPDSPNFIGRYWPPEAPEIFFKPVPLPQQQHRLFFAPEFRLPLYEIALHDSVVTTHHWEYSSLKFSNEIELDALLQLLYMVPPLYHLSAGPLDRDLPAIAACVAEFAPLHAKLWDKPMTAFRFLSDDRRVQQSEFEGAATITVNFSDTARKVGERTLAPMSYRVAGLDDP